jgi:pyruvate,water dikinase
MLLDRDQIRHSSKDVVGGKAWSLSKLAEIASVPDFRVIVPDENLKSDIESLKAQLGTRTGAYAVRSSAAVEDSADASYAGLFMTILGADNSTLADAFEKVAKSGNAGRVREFQRATGAITTTVPRVAVVIQEMIDASAAGVALSFAPNTGRQYALIEGIFGLGEPLVGGAIPPDAWTIDRKSRSVVSYKIGHQIWKQTYAGQVLLPSFERNAPKLDHQQIEAVIDLLFEIETRLKLPAADAEFCFAGKNLYALQARPLLSA